MNNVEDVFRYLPAQRAWLQLVVPRIEVVCGVEVKMKLLPDRRFRFLSVELIVQSVPDLYPVNNTQIVGTVNRGNFDSAG